MASRAARGRHQAAIAAEAEVEGAVVTRPSSREGATADKSLIAMTVIPIDIVITRLDPVIHLLRKNF